MAKKDSKPEKQRKYKDEKAKQDETIATLEVSDEPARIDTVLDEDRLAVRPDAAARLDVFRDGNLEGLQKEGEAIAPDGLGEITDNLGNDIARHDGPGIADMFKSGSEHGLTGTDDVDPLSGQPHIPDEKDGPDTPYRKNDPSLTSQLTKEQGRDFWGVGGNEKGFVPADGRQHIPVRDQVEKVLRDSGVREAEKKAQEIEAQKQQAEREAKEKADKEAKEKAEKEAKEKAEKEAKEKAEKEAKEKEAKEKEAKKKEGEKDGDDDDDETYTTGEVESTPQINTLESGPLLTDHDLLGHRVDPGDETVFEIDKSQIDAVIEEHTTHGTQILTSAEELPAHVDLSVPPTVPGEELKNTGNPLDAEAPSVPPGGSTTGPAPGGGENELAVPNAAGEAVVIDTGAAGAPAVPGGTDFAEPPPDAQQAAPVPGGADLGDDPDDDGVPGPG
ncbi:MAG: hypothetical protein ACT4PI_14620 [Actinomycetota bacterium]